MTQLVRIGAVLLFSCAATASAADDDDIDLDSLDDVSIEDLLDVVVTTATKTEESISESPAIVTVLTHAEIRAWGYRSLQEALQHVVGFYVIDDHMLPNVSVRGVSGGLRSESSVIKVMLDGRSVAFRSTAGNWLGAELVPLSAVERIEIIRGPASALYGADAFLGVINIITRDGGNLDGGELAVNAQTTNGNLGGDQDMAVGLRQGDWELLLSTRLHTDDRSGLELPSSSPAPTIPAHSEDDLTATGLRRSSGTALLKLGYHPSDTTHVRLTAYASMLQAGGEFADWLQLAHGYDTDGRFIENHISLAHGHANLAVETAVDEDLDLTLNVSAFTGKVLPNDRLDTGSDIFYVKRRQGFRGAEAEATCHWRLNAEWSFLAGVGLVWDDEKLPSVLRILKRSVGGQDAGDIHEAASTRQGRRDFVNPGANLQVVWKPLGFKLGVTGGARYDYHNVYGNRLSGRLGVVSTPLEGLHLKLLYGTAFKAPSPLQLHALPYRAGDLIGNPRLEPQRAHTIEGQAAYELGEGLVLTAGLTYNLLLDITEFTPQGVNQIARNVARIGSLSLEGEILARPTDWLTGYINAAYNHTVRDTGEEGYRFNTVGSENVLFPALIINGGVRYRVHGVPLRLTVEASGFSSRRASTTNILQNGEAYDLDPYVLLGATLSTRGLHLFSNKRETVLMLIGRNLLDSAGPDPGFGGIDYPLIGRVLMLQIWQQI